MAFNPGYGIIGLFTIPFMIFYELLCPFFILIGWFVIAASIVLKVINYPYVVLVSAAYFLVGIIMTVTVFVDKMNMKNDYFSAGDVVRAFGIALLDSLLIRPWLFCVEFIAFFKYRKIKGHWVSPTRIQVMEK